MGEEGTGWEARGPWGWVVDPLDGTTNFVSGLPLFSVALACLDDGGTALGVVHAPALGETFRVLRGEGLVTRSQGPGDLSEAVFIVNKAYRPAAVLWRVAGALMQSVRAFRTFGCVSLDLAFVAAGRADGLVLLPADPWDVAAGLLMVSEAGLVAANLTGEPAPDGERGILATRPALLDAALELLEPDALG
jgi:myo-inositol-1(or 4)-monophosphatase